MNTSLGAFPFVHEFLQAMRRHWAKSLVFFFTLMTLTVGLLLVVPRQYESTGIFYVRVGRGGMTLDPTATTSKIVTIQETREAEINSIGDVLASRGLIEKVVDRIGVDPILDTGKAGLSGLLEHLPSLPSFGAASQGDSVDGGVDYNTAARREKAVRLIIENIRVKPTRKAATISVTCRAATPKLARDIVRAIMDTYLDVHIEANRTDGAHDFFVEQFAFQESRVDGLTREIRDFKNKINITSIDGERAALQEQINVLDKRMIEAHGDLAAVEKRVQMLQSQYEQLDDRLVTEVVEGHSHEGNDLMRDRLYELEMTVNKLLVDYTPTHPKVLSAKKELREARDVYDSQPSERKQITQTVNPTKMDLHGTLLNAIATVSGIQAQLASLKTKRRAMFERLDLLNDNEVKLAALKRELEVSHANYMTYAEKLEEARINRELDLERISNVKIVQDPTLVLKAASPKRLLILLLSMVTAFAGAIILAQVCDAADSGLHSSDEVARHLNLPVLAELPKTPARRVMAH